MVSMKDISARCQVSVATVSKALNNRGDISEETKERICRVAKELGYLPNSSARALKTNRTYNIGVLFVDKANCGLTHSYFSHVLDSFRRGAEAEGYDITFISQHAGKSILSYYEHSKYRGVDGVVIACVDFEDEAILELVEGEIPVVTIDYAFNNRTSILSDNVLGMQKVVQHVIDMGHRDIAYIYGESSMVTDNRLDGFYSTLKRNGVEVKEEYIRQGIYHDPVSAAQITDELLTLSNRPTCIIYPDDFSCFGGLNMIASKGLSVPDDISVVGYDGQNIAQVIEPKLTTYKQNTEELGRMAARKLIQLIEQPKHTLIERIVAQGDLIQGKSVRRL
nr:LacI family DNA-binding transcriptional regulator [Eubacterium sp.]